MNPETKLPPIRIVHEEGKPVALVRAKSEARAIRHVTKKRYEAPIADQDHLIAHGSKFTVEVAGDDD